MPHLSYTKSNYELTYPFQCQLFADDLHGEVTVGGFQLHEFFAYAGALHKDVV